MRGPCAGREKAWLLYAATQGQRAESCSSRRALHCWRSMHLSSWQACALTSSIINCIKYIFWIRDGGVFPGEWPLTSPHCCRVVARSIFRRLLFGNCKQRESEQGQGGERVSKRSLSAGPASFLRRECYVTEVPGLRSLDERSKADGERGTALRRYRKDREKCNHYLPLKEPLSEIN